MTITRPTNLQRPFANTGFKNDIPVPSQIAIKRGAASFFDGFPPLDSTAIVAGGIQPDGKDFNGILNYITTHILFRNSGGRYRFDATLAAAIGGYDAGVVLQSDDGLNEYVSVVNGNNTNFNSYPSSIGVSWLPFAGPGSSAIAGSIAVWPTSDVPLGYIECDGSAVSRVSYAALFQKIGVMYGSGNGSTTFSVPDFRGRFLRGWAHGSGVDPDRYYRTNRGDGSAGDVVGSKQDDMMRYHSHYSYVVNSNYPGSDWPYRPQYDPSPEYLSYNSTASGGNETRPVNINVMFCIKY